MKNYVFVITPRLKQLKLIVDMNVESYDSIYYFFMIKKLNHLIYTCFDISIAVGIYSNFLTYLQQLYLEASKKNHLIH